MDVLDGAHPRDPRLARQLVAASDDLGREPRRPQRHADDFRKRTGFTYTVLDRLSGDVVGCVYIYPVRDSEHDARVRSWVRASRADLDVPLWRSVGDWIAAVWPFRSVEYAERPA